MIIATTKKKQDTKLVNLSKKLNINYYRGSTNDVLGRIAGAIKKFNIDIHIELKRFRVDSLAAAKKVLQANREMGASTPIPSWFAVDPKNDCLVFINRLDWRHITCKILEDHILRCIEQMGSALATEGV